MKGLKKLKLPVRQRFNTIWQRIYEKHVFLPYSFKDIVYWNRQNDLWRGVVGVEPTLILYGYFTGFADQAGPRPVTPQI